MDLLSLALQLECSEIVNTLIKTGANVNKGGRFGYFPIHQAIHANLLEISKLLIEAGANVNAQDEDGFTPLHYAIIERN